MKFFLAAALALLAALPAVAQTSMPPNQVTAFKDTSMLRPPAGAKVAILEFEDLECPHCGHAAPIVRAAVAKYEIPYLHHDFPIHQDVWWSLDAAITARYLQDKISPKTAEDFRLDVFANQKNISSKDDLARFTRQWFQKHSLQMSFVIDPKGLFRQEVKSDSNLGERLGLIETPTIFVVGQHRWIQVEDVSQLDIAIERAQSQAGAAAPAPAGRSNVRKSPTPAK